MIMRIVPRVKRVIDGVRCDECGRFWGLDEPDRPSAGDECVCQKEKFIKVDDAPRNKKS